MVWVSGRAHGRAAPVAGRAARRGAGLLAAHGGRVGRWPSGPAAPAKRGNTVLKSYLMSLPLLLLAGKLVILIPLLLEDLTRLGRWAVGSATRPVGAVGEAIPRSEFLAKLALGLGGGAVFRAAVGHGQRRHRLPGAPRDAEIPQPAAGLRRLQGAADFGPAHRQLQLDRAAGARRGPDKPAGCRPDPDDRRPGEQPRRRSGAAHSGPGGHPVRAAHFLQPRQPRLRRLCAVDQPGRKAAKTWSA